MKAKNSQYDYDVLFIGAGHASDGAVPLAKRGYKVAKIEADRVGGTCTNYACNAKIVLDGPVETMRTQQRTKDIVQGALHLNWENNMKYKHEVIDPLAAGMEKKFNKQGIDVIHGWAKFVDQHTLDVDGHKYTADKIVIATGLHPNQLDIPGTELAHDSKAFLDLDKLPKNIAVIGSSYISMEFATIASEFGSEVTVLMHGDRALRKFYGPFVQKVMTEMEANGVTFFKNANVQAFEKDGDQLYVKYGDNEKLPTDWILDATGRNPNLTGYGLDEMGIKYDNKGIIVNGKMQTNYDNIFAAGDVAKTTDPKLTPTATHHSKYIAHYIMGDTDKPMKPFVMPTVTFTSPRIAEAGISVDEAKAHPDKYTINEADVTNDWFREINNDQIGDQIFIYDKEGKLVGATEVSERAQDLVNSVLPAIALKLTPEETEQICPLFPSIMHEGWKKL